MIILTTIINKIDNLSIYKEYKIKKRISVVLFGLGQFSENHNSWFQCFNFQQLYEENNKMYYYLFVLIYLSAIRKCFFSF